MKLTMFEYRLANDMRLCLTREQAISLVQEIQQDLGPDSNNKWDDINDVPKTQRVYDSTGSIWRHDTYDWTFFDDDIGLWVTVPLEQVNSNGPFSLEPQHPSYKIWASINDVPCDIIVEDSKGIEWRFSNEQSAWAYWDSTDSEWVVMITEQADYYAPFKQKRNK